MKHARQSRMKEEDRERVKRQLHQDLENYYAKMLVCEGTMRG